MLRVAVIMAALCGAVTLGFSYLPHGRMIAPVTAASAPSAKAVLAAKPAKGPSNQLVYQADRSGHFFVDAEVNGAPVRFLVDTGATVVALSPEDARAAGIAHSSLRFTEAVSTANGVARVARTTLRDVRLNQLAIEEVAAVVMEESMSVSLLGMSFLSRLDGYSIRDGRLTIEW